MEGESQFLLNPGVLLVILNICSQNQANVVFIAKFGSNSDLKTISIIITPNNMGSL